MGGGKDKSSGQTINSGPYSIEEPPYRALPPWLGGGKQTTFQSMPGQLALIAQQLHTAYPSMPQEALLKDLQSVYKPVTVNDPKIAAAAKKAAAAPAAATGSGSGMTNLERLLSGGHTPSAQWFRNNPRHPSGASWNDPWIPSEKRK